MGTPGGSAIRSGVVAAWLALGASLSLSASLSGCSFDPTFPEGVISCRTEKDCPPGYGCGSGAVCLTLNTLHDGGGADGIFIGGSGGRGMGGSGGGSGGARVDGGGSGDGFSTGSGGQSGPGTGGNNGPDGGAAGSGGNNAGSGGNSAGSGGNNTGSGGSGSGGSSGTDAAPDLGADVREVAPPVDLGNVCAGVCTLGDSRCLGAGLSTCVMVGSCPDWSTPVACQGRKVCQGTAPRAACACAAPPTGCDGGAGFVCAGQTLRTCATDGDGCIYEKSTEPCPAARPCKGAHPGAACTCPDPPAGCASGQGTTCESTAVVVTCGRDSAGCLTATQRNNCPAGKPCTGSAPSASCSCAGAPAQCAGVAGTFCQDGQTVGICALDGDGCLQIAKMSACNSGLLCLGSAPAAACGCPTPPADCAGGVGTVCRGTGQVVTCERDSNGCLAISAVATCPSGKPCGGKAPTAACTCAPPPAECAAGAGDVCGGSGAGQVIHCGADPTTGCVVITSRETCSGSRSCRGGFPSAACTCAAAPSDCASAGKVCRGGIVATCGLDDSNCLATTSTETCGSGLVCVGSFPGAACACPAAPSECSNGAGSYCATGTSRVTCTRGSDTCYHASSGNCPSGQSCAGAFPNATCQPPTALGHQADLLGMGKHLPGNLLGFAVTVTSPVTLRHFGIIARSASQVTMALYRDNGSDPSTLVASVVGQTLAVGINEYPVVAQPMLTAGQYWLMAIVNSDTQIAHDSTAATTTRFVTGLTFSNPLPSALPNPPNMYVGPNMNYYVLVLPQ